jgi:hypothetical protein
MTSDKPAEPLSEEYLEAQTHLARLAVFVRNNTHGLRAIQFFNTQTEENEILLSQRNNLRLQLTAAEEELKLAREVVHAVIMEQGALELWDEADNPTTRDGFRDVAQKAGEYLGKTVEAWRTYQAGKGEGNG